MEINNKEIEIIEGYEAEINQIIDYLQNIKQNLKQNFQDNEILDNQIIDGIKMVLAFGFNYISDG